MPFRGVSYHHAEMIQPLGHACLILYFGSRLRTDVALSSSMLERWYIVLGGVAIGRGFEPKSDLELSFAKILI
jgi:hypothetical protein